MSPGTRSSTIADRPTCAPVNCIYCAVNAPHAQHVNAFQAAQLDIEPLTVLACEGFMWVSVQSMYGPLETVAEENVA